MFFLLSLFTAAGIISWVIYILWYVLLAAGFWRMFEKAGIAGWKALIPVYNFYILFKIAWVSSMFWVWIVLIVLSGIISARANDSSFLYFLANFTDLVQDVLLLILWYKVSLAYGHGIGYTLGLWILNPVFVMIIGFGSSRYLPAGYYRSRF